MFTYVVEELLLPTLSLHIVCTYAAVLYIHTGFDSSVLSMHFSECFSVLMHDLLQRVLSPMLLSELMTEAQAHLSAVVTVMVPFGHSMTHSNYLFLS